jgi:S-adenosylmethionine hydrolase
MKGVILGINPRANIIDVTHDIPRHNITFAAFVVNGYYKYFPKKSVHVVVVDPGVGGQRYDMILRTKDYIFIGPDNGVFSYILINQPSTCYEINIRHTVSATFHGRDVFAPAAASLSVKWDKSIIGSIIKRPVILDIPKPIIGSRGITGEIIHTDHFGNLITNITSDRLHMLPKNKVLDIFLKGVKIKGINDTYEQCGNDLPCAIINSFNLLEITINSGSAHEKLGIKRGDKVKVVWK